MEIRRIHNQQYQADFTKGVEAKLEEIKEMGFKAARDKFNMDHPVGYTPKTLGAFYFAQGEMEALVAAL